MSPSILFALTFAAAIGSGVVGGIFFAFSTFVMAALGRIPPEPGIAAMQSINVTVLNPLFFLAFFGTGALCLVLLAGTLFGWETRTVGTLVVGASLLYLLGTIGVTIAFNVPLNEALAATKAGTPEASALWARYLDTWTFWNHVRTLASIAAAILFTAALL